ncbi:MAG: dTDP-4-dehydrorhamnose 3,5-epimerase [Tepidisphaeraceae bacterium]|jgi:dTDP-4-dehydrorhamnose 3,5-epimerase
METIATAIDGVRLVRLACHADARGSFCEAFRASWFGGDRPWVQWNFSRSKAGVLRGLHFHRQQTDYWFVVDGLLQVALVDLRPDSISHRQSLCMELDGAVPSGLIIPPGVVHGYRALRHTTMMYLLDQEYNGADEYGVRWNDRALGLPESWYGGPQPVLSSRDAAAPMLHEAIW